MVIKMNGLTTEVPLVLTEKHNFYISVKCLMH